VTLRAIKGTAVGQVGHGVCFVVTTKQLSINLQAVRKSAGTGGRVDDLLFSSYIHWKFLTASNYLMSALE
jgi:hypothetical protein